MSIISHTGQALFEGDSITATSFVYNSSGWINTRVDQTYLSLCVATLNATNVSVVVEGKFETYSRPFQLYTDTIATVMDHDEIVAISEKPRYLRVGFKINNTATPNNVYCGVGLVESR